MVTPTGTSVRVGTLAELQHRGCTVVTAGGHTMAVFLHEGRVYALDNRCPHMGFPLSRGTVHDGLLTCHWHHARFDLASGGTLDPFADDVHTFPVRVVDGVVFVELPSDAGERVLYWTRRLEEGLEQQLSLVLSKAVFALLGAGVTPAQIAAIGGRFGLRYRAAGWGPGMTILTACASVLPALAPEDRVPALVHGLARVAADCAGQPPRFPLEPLPGTTVPIPRLKQWFRRAVAVRDEEAAERVLATAIAAGARPRELAELLFTAATDHYYLDDGHTLDFITKACEYLDLVGWQEAASALPALVTGLCRATRSEEQNAWRHPVDLVSLLEPELAALADDAPVAVDGGRPLHAEAFDALVETVLGEDPAATVRALSAALRDGVALPELGLAVAHAAALRLARFHTSNEFGDWDTVHNTWTSCQALAQALRRAPSRELARGLYHAALRVYLDRFLNVPPQRLPDQEPEAGAGLPADPAALRQALLELLDREQQVNPAGHLVDAYLAAGHDDAVLIQTLGHALFREDAGFHAYQTFEAGWRLYRALRARQPLAARRTLVGVTRFLAAHSPTPRALRQTVTIAQRLARGEALYAEG